MITKYLKDYFKKHEITQKEVEHRTGITQYKLSLALNGKRKLTADELLLIAIKFDINLNKIKELYNNESSFSPF